jgi:serine protease inhibitor
MVRSAMLAAAALLALGPSAAAQSNEPSERSEQVAPTPAPRGAAPGEAKPTPAQAKPAAAEVKPEPSEAKPAAGDAERTRTAQSKLAYALIERLDKDKKPDDNVVVSPASLALVLALLDLGADEKLRVAIHRTLGFDLGTAASAPPAAAKAARGKTKAAPKAAVPEVNKDAAAELRRLRDTIVELRGDKALADVFAIANMFVFDPASPPLEAAEIALKAKGAEVRLESLSDPATIKRINEWVAEQTKGLIPSILERPPVNAGLIGLNALYFKDSWQTPFEASATKPTPFQTAGGSTIEVPMMALRSGPRLHREEGNFVALDLPYAHDRFSMIIVTTKDKPVRAAQFASVASWLGGEGFEPKLIELSFPRFALTAHEELLPPLDAMGLKEARTATGSLKNFSPAQQAISQITQKTFLKVDEAGTEAAAVTAVVTARSAGGPRPEKIMFNKPFMFALRDNTTGLVLMAGYVGSPTPGPVAELKQQ